MKTLLVITRDAGLSAALAAGLDARAWRVRAVAGVAAAVEEVGSAIVDAVLVDAAGADAVAVIERARQAFPKLPLIAAVDAAANSGPVLAAGATAAFDRPLQVALLIDWLAQQPAATSRASESAASVSPLAAAVAERSLQALENIAELSAVVARSLEPEELAREFLLHLRRLVGCNRCAVFLREVDPDSDAFLCAHAAARPQLTGSSLGLTSGIGAALVRDGRILRRDASDTDAQREFAEIGAEVAIPILDGRNLVGVALLDRRVTGELIGDRELALLFNAFEVLGLAVAHARQHAKVAASEELAAGVFDTLATGCVVIAPDLTLLHINPAARGMFGLGDKAVLQDLPAAMVARVFAALRNGKDLPRFRHASAEEPGRAYDVSVTRIPHQHGEAGRAALLAIEDVTENERARAMEVESANERLVRSMAEHLSHEIGNALVPLSTGQQLMSAGEVDAETWKGLEGVFDNSVKRITRLTGQMQSLSREGLQNVAEVALVEVIEEAFKEARQRAKSNRARLDLRGGDANMRVRGERKELKQAFVEVLLNALQATIGKPQVEVEIRGVEDQGESAFAIDVRDSGGGFSEDERSRATEPFYSKRTVGIGLGLTVARRVVRLHGGSLTLQPAGVGEGGCVRLTLPAAAVKEAA